MRRMEFGALVSLVLSACFIGQAYGDDDLGRGLGEKFDWHTLEEGLEISETTGKPLMLIIHKSWCGACKSFKPKFAASSEILAMSENFVMVNTLDDEEPKGDKYSPDGGYIPRILFLDSEGNVHPELYNVNGNSKYKYFYFDDKSVVATMKEAIKTLSPASRGEEL
ncbi:putative thioredoxin domain-containing protein 12 [Penaeus vannamei]|uniref:Thioredoxin domain-containing protein 12 n=1 Tax=Penaeus vannamei TaxID=6689 RepID=A0A423SMS1_PENVA|nr:thioredoxin domain-containing protein 12-like [Penaeus vannamei]ROT65492.1 putative thioredoxin domain-containing protein 12 [Penaeus vannamei]